MLEETKPMVTDKMLKIFVVLLLSALCLPANAQREDWQELCAENNRTEKEIKSVKANLDSLENLKTDLEAQQDKLDDQIAKITQDCIDLKNDTDSKAIVALQKEVNDLKEQVNNLQNEKKQLADKISNAEAAFVSKKNDISGMGVYSEINDQRIYSQCQKLLDKPYSQMSSDECDFMESNAIYFSEKPEFNELSVRLKAYLNNKNLYDKAVSLLNVKFNDETIRSTRDKLIGLLNVKEVNLQRGIVKLSEAQYAEIDSLDIKLSRYGKGISVLQDIVNKVSLVREENIGDENACIEAIRAIVFSNNPDDVENRKRYFATIPSLCELYKRYWSEVLKNPFTPTDVETEIMQLKD